MYKLKLKIEQETIKLLPFEDKPFAMELMEYTTNGGDNIEYLFEKGDLILVKQRYFEYVGMNEYEETPMFREVKEVEYVEDLFKLDDEGEL